MQSTLRPLLIDFTPPNWRLRIRRINGISWLLLFIALVSFSMVAYKTLETQLQHKKNIAMMTSLQKQIDSTKKKSLVPLKSNMSTEKIKQINDVVTQLNIPWSTFFESLEENASDEVAFLSIEPNAIKRLVRIQAETKDSEHMLEYIRHFKKSSNFANVVLLKYDINELDPNKPVRFMFEAQWGKGDQ